MVEHSVEGVDELELFEFDLLVEFVEANADEVALDKNVTICVLMRGKFEELLADLLLLNPVLFIELNSCLFSFEVIFNLNNHLRLPVLQG